MGHRSMKTGLILERPSALDWRRMQTSRVRALARPQSRPPAPAGPEAGPPPPVLPFQMQALVKKYCVTCHNARTKTGGLSLEGLDPAAAASHADVWEKVVMKLRGGMMPPQGMPRPDEADARRVRGLARADARRAGAEARPTRATSRSIA